MPEAQPTGAMLQAWGLYRRFLRKYFSTVDLAGLAPDDEPLALRQIYVPLVLTPIMQGDENPEDRIHLGGRSVERWLQNTYDGADALKGKQVVEYGEADWRETCWRSHRTLLISGEAGSGKTTLVRALVNAFAGDDSNELATRLRGFIPLPLVLREAPVGELASLEALVEWWFDQVKREEPGLEMGPLRAYLDRGWGLLLLDGLDEVGSVDARQRVVGWAQRSPWTQGEVANLTVFTGRPTGFEGLKLERTGSEFLHVAPFSRDQVREYLDRWFRLRPMVSVRREEVVESLLERLTSGAEANRLRPLARRPAYLAALALVHGTRGELPHSRAALYELLVDAYIDMLDRQRGLEEQRRREGLPVWDRKEKIQILSAVATQAHVGATSDGAGPERRFLFSRETLVNTVGKAIDYYGEERFRTVRREHAKELADYFRARTGLLVERREGQYQFGHLSLQEYLTAIFLVAEAGGADDKARALAESLFPRLSRPGWQEVAILALAIDSDRTGGAGHRGILAKLDLRLMPHNDLLGRVLAGEELRLTADERHNLLLAWCAGLATSQAADELLRVATQPANGNAIEVAWRVTCRWLADENERATIAAALRAALRTTKVEDIPGDLLALTARDSSRRHDSHAAFVLLDSLADHEAEAAPILAMPLLADLKLANSEAELLPVVERISARWTESHCMTGLSTGWAFLEPWALHAEHSATRWALIKHTPLLWGVVSEALFLLAALDTTPPRAAHPASSGKVNVWRRLLRTERWALLGLVSRSSVHSRERQDLRPQALSARSLRTSALALARGRELIRVLARDRSMAPTPALERARVQARALPLRRNQPETTALTLAMNRSRALDLTWHEARYLALDLARYLSPTRRDALVSTTGKHLINQAARMEHLGGSSPKVEAPLAAISVTLSSLSLDPFLDPANLTPGRAEVEAELAAFCDLEVMAKDIAGGNIDEQARFEWQQVLDSPLSPVPLLEALLELPNERFDVTTEVALDVIDRALDELEASAQAKTE